MKNITITNYKACKSLFSKAKGLMFSLSIKKPLIFFFEKEKINSLHMFFVFFPIDVLFLDKNTKVIEIKKNLKPFRIYNPERKSKYVIELKKGSIKEKKIKINDRIIFRL